MRFVFIFLFFYVNLFATINNTSVKYDISYGIFGKLGQSDATITTKKDNSYKIDVKAYATGFAKILSGGLSETYQSYGEFKNGKFKPNFFKKITAKNDKIKTYEYNFDYKNKKILYKKTTKEKKYTQMIDINNPNKKRQFKWETTTKQSYLNFWANEDILSLFFNVKYYMKDKTKQSIRAVGAGTSRKGLVDIIIPKGEKDILIVKIYKKIFGSKQGELYITLNKDGICKTAILKDVIFFGDIVGKLQ
jgi:hypothetical protein